MKLLPVVMSLLLIVVAGCSGPAETPDTTHSSTEVAETPVASMDFESGDVDPGVVQGHVSDEDAVGEETEPSGE